MCSFFNKKSIGENPVLFEKGSEYKIYQIYSQLPGRFLPA